MPTTRLTTTTTAAAAAILGQGGCAAAAAAPGPENNYLRVSWDARFGLTGVLDKQSGRHFPLRHRLYEYEMASTNCRALAPHALCKSWETRSHC